MNSLEEFGKVLLFKKIFNKYNSLTYKVYESDAVTPIDVNVYIGNLTRDCFNSGSSYDFDTTEVNKVLDEMPLTQIKDYFKNQLVNYYNIQIKVQKESE